MTAIATKSMRDEIRLSARHPVLRDHLVHGRHVLPGLAYVDLFYQAFRERGLDPHAWWLRNLSIYHPLSLASGQEIAIELESRSLNEKTWRIEVHGADAAAPNRRRRYCSAQMIAIEPVAFTETLDLRAVIAAATERTPLDAIYAQCRAHGLSHTGFMRPQGMRYANADAVHVECAIDPSSAHEGLELMFHPALLDGCAIGVGDVVEGATGGPLPLFLPIFIESFRAARELPERCIARIRRDTVRTRRELCLLTLELFDEHGVKVAELANLTTKAVRDPRHLDPLHGASTTQPAPMTRTQPVPVAAATAHDSVERFVRELLAQRLGIDARGIDPHVGYYDLGLDSASLLEMTQQIEDRVREPISPTLLFEHANAAELAAHLLQRYGARWQEGSEEAPAEQGGDYDTALTFDAPLLPLAPSVAAPADDIAIIGMAGRFPMAGDVRELWSNLLAGMDCVSEVPAARWDWRLLGAVKSTSGKAMSRWGGFLADADCFDAEFFRVLPRDAETMDPQERQFLEVAWEAIEDAGYTPARLAGGVDADGRPAAIGVFAGAMHKDYSLLGAQRLEQRQVLPLSLSAGMIANRVSYFCNFHGPSITVDTVCSSSLTAVHLALESIRHGECAAALAGGVNLSLHPAKYLSYGMADMHASDGRCRSFGAGGDGYVSSEAVGVVVLKPLRNALADRDAIYCVIKASAVNHVGAVSGFSVPSPAAQADMIVQCLRKAGVDARTIGYVEAHGTGTSLGDPIEIEGLSKAFRRHTADRGFCAIGSLKSNIGHAEAAAGVAGLIKTALQLAHRTLVPSLHAHELNPHIDWQATPFVLQARTQKWRRPWREENGRNVAHPRRAAVSSFGATGSNAHLVLEEYRPARARSKTATDANAAHVLVLSARSAETLRALARRLGAHLERSAVPLSDLAYTLQIGREAFSHRLAIVARDVAQVKARLDAFARHGDIGAHDDCFVGESRAHRAAVRLLSSDEDSGEVVAKWIAKGKLDKLAQLWTQGYAIDWSKLHAVSGPRRVHLPGYPFERKRYWLPELTDAAPSAPRVESAAAESAPQSAALGRALFAPHWEAVAQAAGAQAWDGEQWVLFAGWPTQATEAARAACAAQWPQARVTVLEGGGSDVGERVERLGWSLLQQVQAWLESKPSRALRIQVVIPLTSQTLYALSAMLKTAHLEQPLLQAQVVGVAELSAALPAQLRQCAAQAASELRFEGEQCQARAYRMLPGATVQVPWRRGGVYLISGGAGGLGLLFAAEIGRRTGAATVVLCGRSALTAAQERALEAVAQTGVTVEYRRADVSDAEAVDALVADIVQRHGALHGVVHSAGVLRDGFLLKKRWPEYRAVLAPKVRGVYQLDRATRGLALECFVLFSSATGVHGNVGQGDYALANAFLDGYARERAQAVVRGACAGRTLALGWPLWAAGGMQVDAARLAELRTFGAEAMDDATGIAALYAAYGSGEAQVQVLYGAATSALAAPEAAQVPARADAERWSDADLRERTQQQLQRLFATVTKLGLAQIDVREPLESYGIDSILIMQLNAKLAAVFGELSKTLFYEYPTLAELGEWLLRERRDACLRWCGSTASVPLATPAAAAAVRVAPAQRDTPTLPTPRDARADAIAIVGLSGRYPQARTLAEFWRNLESGRDCIGEIPAERWPLEGFYEADMERAIAHGRSYSKWGGFVDGFAEFDSLFFNISPREALNLDPQERLFLETCWAAMEDAGYTRERFATQHQRRVGVFAGITKTGFDLYGPELWRRGETIAPWTSFGSLANRVSYVLNLQGPSMPIDTMCSASLTAIHEACEHLLRGECELAFAGGVNLYLHPANYTLLCTSRMLSASGRCQSFGAAGDGFVPGEGVGVVLLKPLARALADRDPIHGVIRATSINHGGKTNGYTVPNPVAQRELIAAALAKAGIDARAVSYIEAHGTGTELGDPIEITGLTQAFAQHTTDTQFCAIGSVKSNIGHCESAAGIAGLTKVLLQFKHGALAPSLHVAALNANIDFAATPFVVQRALAPWPRPRILRDGVEHEYARIAGISSFGAGGANAHVIVEEFVAPADADATTPARATVIVLSARTEDRLLARIEQLRDAILAQALGDADLANLAYTLAVGREAMEHRIAFTVDSMAQLSARLAQILAGADDSADVHRGEVKRNKDMLALFVADEELKEAIAKWLERGKYPKVLDLWVKGLAFDWTRLYAAHTPRTIPLPTYPFARERHWLDTYLAQAREAVAQIPQPGADAIRTRDNDISPVRRTSGKPSVVLRALSTSAVVAALAPAAPPRVDEDALVASARIAAPPDRIESPPTEVEVARPSLQSIQDSLRDSLAKALFIERKNIGLDDVFVEFGLDSIVGVEWTHAINRSYELALAATRLYDYPTLRELSVYVAAELDKRPQAAPSPAPRATPQASSVTDVVPDVSRAAPPPPMAALADASVSSAPAHAAALVANAPLPSHGVGMHEGIAIVGMSGRYPGARDLDTFWNNIAAGIDSVGDVPRERWAVDDFYDAGGEALGTTYCRAMGALDGVAEFDPLFFGIAPSEAYVMDPQQRLFLQACWECIEDAAIDATSLAGTRCGVFAGCGAGDYGMGPEAASAQGLIGGSSSILAARISYFLDLRGPCLAIDTACSSSLVAIASACDSLLLGQSDAALAGGVCVLCSPAIHLTTSNAGMLSKRGRCQAFDQQADGFVPAEGVGVLLLKRLGDATRDRDQIHGVIRGWGVNQDGRTNGITAPSVKSQIALERDVYARFAIDPGTIGLVEAHGTGTKLGDPIEVEALIAAFRGAQRDAAPATNYCALGSVKSNIGHALTAAAVASVLKVLLAMRHRALPPTLHFAHLNEHIDLDGSPFYINDCLREWPAGASAPRRAAVSSFGFSGTNAHCVIEQAPARAYRRTAHGAYLVVLSSKSLPQLREQASRLAAHCQRHAPACADVSCTLLLGRKHFSHRLACVVADTAELCVVLRRWAEHGVTEGVGIAELDAAASASQDAIAHGNACIAAARASREQAAARQALAAVASSYLAGCALDYANLFDVDCNRISLPTYAFARERYWFGTAAATPLATPQTEAEPAAGAPMHDIFDAVMDGTLDIGKAAARLRSLVDDSGVAARRGLNGHSLDGVI